MYSHVIASRVYFTVKGTAAAVVDYAIFGNSETYQKKLKVKC